MNPFDLTQCIVGLSLGGLSIYLGIELLCYWIPLIAFRIGRLSRPPIGMNPELLPKLVVVIPCRNAERSLRHLLLRLKDQTYPQDRFSVVAVIDKFSDRPEGSVAVAESMGAKVYSRRDPVIRLKGAALNDALQNYLRFEEWDALVMLDVDARFDRELLSHFAGRLGTGSDIIQGSTYSKNPESTPITRIGDAVQAVIRIHQTGRAILGLDPLLIGSHSFALRRGVLESTRWEMCNSRHMGDDLELNLKRFLSGFRILYAPEIGITNDLPESLNEIRIQRRRWSALCFEALPEFTGPLLREIAHGNWRAIDMVFGLLVLPSFASLFGTLLAIASALWLAVPFAEGLRGWAMVFSAFWLADVFYFIVAFSSTPTALRPRDYWALARFLAVRFWAVAEGFVLAFRHPTKDRWPTHHKGDDELMRTNTGGPVYALDEEVRR